MTWSFNGDLCFRTLEGADIVMEMYQKGELEQVEKGYQGIPRDTVDGSDIRDQLFPSKNREDDIVW